MALSGRLARLAYVAGLRNGARGYEHWGLQKAYGGEAARRAIHEAHVRLVAEILSTPLNDLWAEGLTGGNPEQTNSSLGTPQRLLADDDNRATILHLKAVLASLSALSESRASAATRAA